LKNRQPLARAIVVADVAQRESLTHLRELAADELNVKSVEYATREEELVTYQLRPNFATLNEKVKLLVPEPETDDKQIKKDAREKRKAVMGGLTTALNAADASQVAATVRAGNSFTLDVNGLVIEIAPSDVLVTPQPKPGFAVASEATLVVALDTTLTDELVAEGRAREFVRRVQDLRKNANFEIADHIRVDYIATPKLARAIETWREYIAGETLANELRAGDAPSDAASVQDSFDGEQLTVAIRKV
jgi:isoleucyl-tRNA synthetase